MSDSELIMTAKLMRATLELIMNCGLLKVIV